MIKMVKNEPPLFTEMLGEIYELSKDRKMQGVCVVYIMDDKVYTDYVKADGTSLLELLGAVEVMRQEIIDRMRE